ncbi:DUF3147 family protein [Ramlibacter rhizophilus]|uniref:DUF3147 family protein n=1 Tax=Ramlibacter rhizophilus TaxID=1781167 RepID=A0A4Z0BGM4_9BURK|nr:DUF3147 family protein [Ramlibacter rhizophilus]TFY97529.1 DUF3147 family protein [Ramlibacter rhizophilus]
MLSYAVKIALTALLVVAVSEIAKRNTLWAAALAALPLTSVLAFVWMWVDGVEMERIASLSTSILWLVIPSLLLFVLLPLLLRAGWSFWSSLGLSCLATALAYGGVVLVLDRLGMAR